MPAETITQVAATPEISIDPIKAIIGVGAIIGGFIILVILCRILSLFQGRIDSDKLSKKAVYTPTQSITNDLVAALSCAIAEDMGKDVKAIRILSIKAIE
jgi:hypothetical protein